MQQFNVQIISKPDIIFLGAGNVAWHLAGELKNNGFNIKQIYSRTLKSATELALRTDSEAVNLIENIEDTELYIVSVPDKILQELSKNKIFRNKINNKLVIHTAGSVDMDILSDLSENFGVFYPLQTFSKQKKINFSDIPICIEANSVKNENILLEIAGKISTDVQKINSLQRKYIHLSAVFSCNFVNRFYSISEEILAQNNINFDILKPLIKETTEKLLTIGNPKELQTGPAVRNDIQTMKKHLELLKTTPDYQKLYKIISENIKGGKDPTF